MARNTAAALAAKTDIVYDSHGPCRVYITSLPGERDKQGRTLWHCYFALNGGKDKQLIPSEPLRWREASRLAHRLNTRSGLIEVPDDSAA